MQVTACARDEELVRASSVFTANRDIALNAGRVGREWFPWPVPVVRGGLKYFCKSCTYVEKAHLANMLQGPRLVYRGWSHLVYALGGYR